MEPDIEDTIRVTRLYARYAHAIDRGDGDAWSNCFAMDGVYWSTTFGECRGRDSLRQFAGAHYRRWTDLGIQTRHWNNQVLLEEADGGLRGSVYVMLLGVERGNDPRILLQTVYNDLLVREGADWRIRERRSYADSRPDPSRFGFQKWEVGSPGPAAGS